jgi:hypothetical protein
LDYFRGREAGAIGGGFHKVVALHEQEVSDWDFWQIEVPGLPRGWFELSRLSADDRIEFLRAFWAGRLPYSPKVDRAFNGFFNRLEDVGVYLTQEGVDTPMVAQLVYALEDEGGFFHAYPPASEEALASLLEIYEPQQLPADYLAFLSIHNGFCKATDTGVLSAMQVEEHYDRLQALLAERSPLTWNDGEIVNREHLIPFYQSFGLDSYQCFFADWYPENEMGNLFYSAEDHTVADHRGAGSPAEKQAFATFLDWLAFYCEFSV